MEMIHQATAPHPLQEFKEYVAQIREFGRADWYKYSIWIGSLVGLFISVVTFLTFGVSRGVEFPLFVWWVPIGTGIFMLALAIDDIGHRTRYKQELAKGEGYVHQMIGVTAVMSVVGLILCFEHRELMTVPSAGFILLSFFYSGVDEAMHWSRYFRMGVDRIEMWAHFMAITGHVLMIGTWWHWAQTGYPGFGETLKHLANGF